MSDRTTRLVDGPGGQLEVAVHGPATGGAIVVLVPWLGRGAWPPTWSR